MRGDLVVDLADFGADELLGGARGRDRERESEQTDDEYRLTHLDPP